MAAIASDGGRIDEVLDDYYDRVVGPYWPPERRWVETGYRTPAFSRSPRCPWRRRRWW
jgi:hypothetical protein